MSWELVLGHCKSVRSTIETTRVSLELASAQLAALEAYAKAGCAKETATQSLPEYCQGVADGDCGLRSEDARIDQGTMSHPRKWVCKGCRVISMDGVTT